METWEALQRSWKKKYLEIPDNTFVSFLNPRIQILEQDKKLKCAEKFSKSTYFLTL